MRRDAPYTLYRGISFSLFIPGASDPKIIAELIKEIDGPITVVMGLQGATLTVAQLADLGVRRITIGGSLARATYGLIRQAAQEMAGNSTFNSAHSSPKAKMPSLSCERCQLAKIKK